MDKIVDFLKKFGDPFETLELSATTNIKVIEKSYKELARKYHPDKSNHKDKFIQIKRAADFLRENAENCYKYFAAQKLKEQLRQQQSSEQRALQEDLLRRERAAEKLKQERAQYQAMKLNEELKLIEEARQRDEQERKEKRDALLKFDLEHKDAYSKLNSIKVQWGNNEAYNKDLLSIIFSSYGPIKNIELKPKKQRATVEFHTTEAANFAVLSKDAGSLSVKFRMKPEKRQQLQEYLKSARQRVQRQDLDSLNLSSDTLKRIAHHYNKDSKIIIDDEVDMLRRRQERERLMQELLKEELEK